jgi:hypothetical protein
MSETQTDDERYLRTLGYAEDAWVLSGQQWYTAAEAAAKLGISHDAVSRLAETGAIPGALLHDVKRIGWRLPRSGLIAYVAHQRRHTEERKRQVRDKGTA